MQPRLSKGAIVEVERRVDQMFDRLLTRLLGGHFSGKHMFIQVDPTLSLPGLFTQAVSEEGGSLDLDLLQNLADITKHLVDKHRAEAKATTVRRIQMLLQDVKAGRVKPEHFRNHVESEMIDTWDRITSNVERVVDTESMSAVTLGLKDGIDQMNTARGITDPVVVFIPKQDAALCDECRRTHLIGTTPRAWYSSEVSSDYHQRGEDRPSWQRMHPHCRCSLATILPGFGFDAGGRVTFIADGFKELEYQRANSSLGGVEDRRAWRPT